MKAISFLCCLSLLQLCAAHQMRQLQQVYMRSSLTLNKTGAGVARLEQSNYVKTNNKYSFVDLNNRGVSIIEEEIKTSVYQHLVAIQNVDGSDSGVCNNLEVKTSETAVVIARAISSAYIKTFIDVRVRYAKVVSRIEGVALAIAQAFVQVMIDVTVQAINEISAAQAGVMLQVFVEDIQQAVAKTLTEIEVVSAKGEIVSAKSGDEAFSQGLAEALAAIMYEAFAKVNGCDDPTSGQSVDLVTEGELTYLNDYTFDVVAVAPTPPPVVLPPPLVKSNYVQYGDKELYEQAAPTPTPTPVPTPIPTPTPTPSPDLIFETAENEIPDQVVTVTEIGTYIEEKHKDKPVEVSEIEQKKALRAERKQKRILNQQRLAERRAKLLANQLRKQKIYEENQARKAQKYAQRQAQKAQKNKN